MVKARECVGSIRSGASRSNTRGSGDDVTRVSQDEVRLGVIE